MLIYLLPMLLVVLTSFTDYTFVSDHWDWIGAENYRRMFDDAQFGNALRDTLIYAALFLPGAFVIPLFLAITIQARKRFRSILEVIYFLPVT